MIEAQVESKPVDSSPVDRVDNAAVAVDNATDASKVAPCHHQTS
jgi:hypothetical protein